MTVSAGTVADPVADAPPADSGAPLPPDNILVFARSAAPAAPEPARSLAG
ncbi:hypothetical protein [Methylobacterium sp. Leaf118]|nr:hypothetical protein [Methylobacterium sp. Leaf118]